MESESKDIDPSSTSQPISTKGSRPITLDIRPRNGSNGVGERLSSSSEASSTRSDALSDSSISSQEFEMLRAKEGLDLDMGPGDCTAAEIFDHSHIDIDDETSIITSSTIITPTTADQSSSANGHLPMSSQYWSCDPSVGVPIRMGKSGRSAAESMTVVDAFQQTVKDYGKCLALSVKRRGMWMKWTYDEYYHECKAVARAFIQLGLKPYHSVCIIGFNSPEWHISLIGAIMAGGIGTGLYLTCTAEGLFQIAESCKANIIVVENDSQLEKALQVKDQLPELKAIIHYCDLLAGVPKEEYVYKWTDIISMDTDDYEEELRMRMKGLLPNKCCSLLYTSGTTGRPKGVMLSHDNIIWNSCSFRDHAKCTKGQERVISYLPLAHIAPQLLDIFVMIVTAGSCWFAQPNAMKGSLINTLKEVRPTLFLGVPRVWDKIAENMQLVMQSMSGFKAWLSGWARGIGLKGNLHKQSGGSGTPLGWTIANAIVLNKARKLLGLDNCHFPMTGSAPISQDTLTFFMSLNIPICELYGMSECTAACTVTTGDVIRFKSVGIPLPGVEVRFSDIQNTDLGELQVRGRTLMMGYLGDPESTVKAFTSDGYLRSGDLGYMDEDGFVFVTGRLKEMIITATGDNILPTPIEALIKKEAPIISNVVLIGDKRDYLVCLITLKVEFDYETGLPTEKLNPAAKAICVAMNINADTVGDIKNSQEGKKVLKTIQKSIDKANKSATAKEHKVMKWAILDKDFSVTGGELSSTLKLKRNYIADKYSHVIEGLYEE